jgi:hypothetical protein
MTFADDDCFEFAAPLTLPELSVIKDFADLLRPHAPYLNRGV